MHEIPSDNLSGQYAVQLYALKIVQGGCGFFSEGWQKQTEYLSFFLLRLCRE